MADHIKSLRKKHTVFTKQIDALKDDRKERSARLQDRLFEQYTFKNINGVSKSLKHIFEATILKHHLQVPENALLLSFFNTHLLIV